MDMFIMQYYYITNQMDPPMDPQIIVLEAMIIIIIERIQFNKLQLKLILKREYVNTVEELKKIH